MTPGPLREDGPADAPLVCALAHGAGAGMDSPFLAAVAAALGARGIRVVRFEFPYQQQRERGGRRAPDPLPVLQAHFRAVLAELGHEVPVALAGKSLGGRVATTIADSVGAAACVAFGYPFHPPRRPAQLRTAHLRELRTPTLILQGERDPFGVPAEVAEYALSPAITVQWLPDGDHSLEPRVRSGHTKAGHLATACDAAATFLLAHARRGHGAGGALA